MGRIEITGRSLLSLLLAVTWLPMGFLLVTQVSSASHPAGIGLVAVIVLLLVANGVAVWRLWTGQKVRFPREEDGIAWDPVAYPGQAAKQRWQKAVDRLPDGDD